MAQRSSYSSAGMRMIHRELDRRRKLAAVAKGGVTKKSSAPPPPRRSAPIPSAPAGAATKNSCMPLPRSATIARSPRRKRFLAALTTTPPPRASTLISPAQGGAAIKKSSALIPSVAHRSSCSSAGMRVIDRELERRRKLAANGGVAKKYSAPSPPLPRGYAPAGAAMTKPSAPARAAINKLSAPAGAAIKKPPAPRSPQRELVVALPQPPPRAPFSAASDSIKWGTTVRVRTPVGSLPTGQCLVLWLSAVVVSVAEAGYVEVIYNGEFPRDNPSRTVRVARDKVKNMPTAVSAPVPAAAAPSRPLCGTAAPRPTVAGKSLPLLKRLEKDMRSS